MKLRKILLENNNHEHGVMVALLLEKEAAAKLAQPGGEDENELHITLAYLGKKSRLSSELIDRIESVCSEMAAKCKPFSGKVTGVGRFDASDHSDGKDVLYAKPVISGLGEFRKKLVSKLKRAGAEVSENFAFNPHITLLYVDQDEDEDDDMEIPQIQLSFRELSLCFGPEHHSFPFAG